MSFPSGFGSFPYWGNDPSGKYFSDEEESDQEVNDFFSSSDDHDNDVLMVDTDASSSTSKQTTIEIDLSQSGEEEEEEEAIAVSPPFTSELPSEDNALIIDEKKEEWLTAGIHFTSTLSPRRADLSSVDEEEEPVSEAAAVSNIEEEEESESIDDWVTLESFDEEKGQFAVSLSRLSRWGNVDALKVPFTNPLYSSFTSRKITLDFSSSLLRKFTAATNSLRSIPQINASNDPKQTPADLANAVDQIRSEIDSMDIDTIYELLKFAEFYSIPQLICVAKEKIRNKELLQNIEEGSIETLWKDASEISTEPHYRKLILELLLFYHLQRNEYEQAAKSLEYFFSYFNAQDFPRWLTIIPPGKAHLSFFIEKLVSMGARGAIRKEIAPDLTIKPAESSIAPVKEKEAEKKDAEDNADVHAETSSSSAKEKETEKVDDSPEKIARRLAKGKERISYKTQESNTQESVSQEPQSANAGGEKNSSKHSSAEQNFGVELAFELLYCYMFFTGAGDDAFKDQESADLEKERSTECSSSLEPFLAVNGVPLLTDESEEGDLQQDGFNQLSTLMPQDQQQMLHPPQQFLPAGPSQPYPVQTVPPFPPTQYYFPPAPLQQYPAQQHFQAHPYPVPPPLQYLPQATQQYPAQQNFLMHPQYFPAGPSQHSVLLPPGIPVPSSQFGQAFVFQPATPKEKKSTFPIVYMHSLFTLANEADSFAQAENLLSFCGHICYPITPEERLVISQKLSTRQTVRRPLELFAANCYPHFSYRESLISSIIFQLAFNSLVSKGKMDDAFSLVKRWMDQVNSFESIDPQAVDGPIEGIEATLKKAVKDAFYATLSYEEFLLKMGLYLKIRQLWIDSTQRAAEAIEPRECFSDNLNVFFKGMAEEEMQKRVGLLIELFPDPKLAVDMLPQLKEKLQDAPKSSSSKDTTLSAHGVQSSVAATTSIDIADIEDLSPENAGAPTRVLFTEEKCEGILIALKAKGRHAALKKFRSLKRAAGLGERELHDKHLKLILSDLYQYDLKQILKFARLFDDKYEKNYVGQIFRKLFEDNKFKEFLELQTLLKPEENGYAVKILKDRMKIAEKMIEINQIESAIDFFSTYLIPAFSSYSSNFQQKDLSTLFTHLTSTKDVRALNLMRQTIPLIQSTEGCLLLSLNLALDLSNRYLDIGNSKTAEEVVRSCILPHLQSNSPLEQFFTGAEMGDFKLFHPFGALIGRFIKARKSKTAQQFIAVVKENWKAKRQGSDRSATQAKRRGRPAKRARLNVDIKLNSFLPHSFAIHLRLNQTEKAFRLLNRFKSIDRKFDIIGDSMAFLGATSLEKNSIFNALFEFAEKNQGKQDERPYEGSNIVFSRLFQESLNRHDLKKCETLLRGSLTSANITHIEPVHLAKYVRAIILEFQSSDLENSLAFIEEVISCRLEKLFFSLHLGQSLGEMPKEYHQFDFIMRVKNMLPHICQLHFLKAYLTSMKQSYPDGLLHYVAAFRSTFGEALLLEAHLQDYDTSGFLAG